MAVFAFESYSAGRADQKRDHREVCERRREGRCPRSRAAGWIVENCEVRLNSGAGIAAGAGGRVRGCNIHDNGQIGIAGVGKTS